MGDAGALGMSTNPITQNSDGSVVVYLKSQNQFYFTENLAVTSHLQVVYKRNQIYRRISDAVSSCITPRRFRKVEDIRPRA